MHLFNSYNLDRVLAIQQKEKCDDNTTFKDFFGTLENEIMMNENLLNKLKAINQDQT